MMTERDLTQSMEELEPKSERQATQELNQATHEPGARVEQIGSTEQAEAIETAITDLVGTDRKVSQTDPPKTTEEELKPTKKDKEGGDAATPINLPSPESKAGTTGEKTEPDPKGSEVKVADDPKPKSAEQTSGDSEKPESLEATPITLPGKESPATSSPPESQELEGRDTATMEPQRLDKELPESKTVGKQKPEQDLGKGLDPTGDIGGIMDDTFGLGKDLEGGGFGDPQGGIGGIGSIEGPDGIGIGIGTPQNLDAGLESEMPREMPGGPGYIHPAKGPMGQGQIMDGGDKGIKGQKGSTSGQDSGTKGQDSGTKGQDSGTKGQQESGTKGKKGGDTSTTLPAIVITAELPGRSEDNPIDAGSVTIDMKKENALIEMQLQLDALNVIAFQIAKENAPSGGSGVKTPRPDGDDGSVEAPQSEEDIKREDMVVDPASTMGTVQSSGIDHRKHQGVVSDPAEWQDPDTPDGGIKTDRTLATDPPGEELGKEKSLGEEE